MYLDTSVFTQSFDFLCCVVDVGYYYGGFVVVLLAGLLLLLEGLDGCGGWLNLCSHWLSAHEGNW